ncbi:MAG: OprO/OprP family phosphate-selective porin [Prevotella sp.]|jgi:hypothetical protein|nr:OprO/OprP family phosphate-selective porin [Prevotella sp.]
MKKQILLFCLGLTLSSTTLYAQGDNTGYGGNENGDYESLAHRVLNLEKKNDMFNVYFNYSYSFQEERDADKQWGSHFADKQLRLEIKGNLTDHLYYRFRHRLNKSTDAQSQDNFAKATDIMMAGYRFNPKISVEAGKMCQIWGGFEFDENPMYIYQYSDMVDNMDNFMAGVVVNYNPLPSQTFSAEISNAYNGKFADEYGTEAKSVGRSLDDVSPLTKAKNPLTYIVNWNGNFFGDKLQTKWSWGIQTQAQHKYSRMVVLGQKLNLPTVQWYVDYMGAFDGLDRLKIASTDLASSLKPGTYFSDVHYNSFISKVNWQFTPRWNFMAEGTYETASVQHIEKLKNYRKSIGYIGSIEYYPLKKQDLRFFLAYVGHNYDFSHKCDLHSYSTSRIELGFMYRIKAF